MTARGIREVFDRALMFECDYCHADAGHPCGIDGRVHYSRLIFANPIEDRDPGDEDQP